MRTRDDPRLCDDDAVAWDPRDELELRLAVDRERARVARVDAEHGGAERDPALELGGVVRLDERVEPEPVGLGHQRDRRVVVEVAQQEQRRVRAGLLRRPQVVRRGEEALGEERHVARGACRTEIVPRAGEALVDEDRDGGRAGPAIRRRDARRVRVRVVGRRRRASAA